jgi:hypothetical protein
MKQTAVEWLWNESQSRELQASDFEQALAMEKEQMFELWNGGINCTEEGGKSFDQYYNETYGTHR